MVDYYYYDNKLIEGLVNYEEDRVKLYPNPASSTAIIELPEEISRSYVEIYTLSGVLLLSEYIENKKTLPIEYLPNGVYFVKITFNDKLITKKLIINKN